MCTPVVLQISSSAENKCFKFFVSRACPEEAITHTNITERGVFVSVVVGASPRDFDSRLVGPGTQCYGNILVYYLKRYICPHGRHTLRMLAKPERPVSSAHHGIPHTFYRNPDEVRDIAYPARFLSDNVSKFRCVVLCCQACHGVSSSRFGIPIPSRSTIRARSL